MNVKLNITGPISVKFSEKIWFVSWNKTVSKTLDEHITLATVDASHLSQHITLAGPVTLQVDYVAGTSKGKDQITLSLMLAGMISLYSQTIPLDSSKSAVVTIKDVRGVNAKLNVGIELV